MEKTNADAESVVGEECHIISGAAGGPRFDPELNPHSIDDYHNLLLLCAVDHKRVDDQFATYSVSRLRALKAEHERWVDTQLSQPSNPKPVRRVRIKDQIPERLSRITSGTELLNLATACHGHYHGYPDDLSADEIELVGGFLQTMSDWSDIGSDLEPLERMRSGASITDDIRGLEASGFYVFAARERQRLEGGVGAPANLHMLHLQVARATDPSVVRSAKEL